MKVTRLFEVLDYQLAHFPKNDALVRKEDGVWKPLSSQEVKNLVNKTSLALLESGIKKDDKLAIISANRPEWNIVDHGIQQLGAVSVPIYPTVTVDDFAYIFKDSEVKIIFVSNEELYLKAKEAIAKLGWETPIYTFDQVSGAINWNEWLKKAEHRQVSELEVYKNAVAPSDLLTLIYTSGTTGTPKGVMLSHNNILSNVLACQPLMPVDSTCKILSFLPMCHVYERMMSYLYMYTGVSIYYAESIDTIGENLKEVHPHMFTTVPRLLEKVYDKIYAKGLELTGIKRKLFFWALDLGLRYEINTDQGWWYNTQLKLANKLIFSKWREALGGNVRAIVSGSAALQPRLARVFWAAGINVMEGYGLTETSPVIAVNRCQEVDNRIGTVGPLIEGVEVKLAEDGEILTRGPHIMMGYYKLPEKTDEAIKDGWFHTGDIGTFVEGRFLKITDRKKEIFKTSGGKYVAPQILENKFKESIFIEQMMVVGENQKFPGALIVPSFDAIKEYCRLKSIPFTTNEEIIKHPQIIDKIQREMDHYNEGFAQYEKLKQFRLLPKLWTIDAGELTPTMKCKRKVITERYLHLIEDMYKD